MQAIFSSQLIGVKGQYFWFTLEVLVSGTGVFSYNVFESHQESHTFRWTHSPTMYFKSDFTNAKDAEDAGRARIKQYVDLLEDDLPF